MTAEPITAKDTPGPRRTISGATLAGLFLALFGMLIVRQAVYAIYGTLTYPAALWKESLTWLCAIALLLIIRLGEGLPLGSIGIGRRSVKQSLAWGGLLTLICGVLAFGIAALTHYGGGSSDAAMEKLPLWLITCIVLRAGVVEELFYRGYAIERLQMAGLNRFWAGTAPLIIFAVAHWTGGWANIVIALVLGAILTIFYMWRRDLVANMIGHFMVDFIANVLPRLLG